MSAEVSSQDNRTILVTSNFSNEQLIAICEILDGITCECPGYLVKLLREIKKFRQYTLTCVEQFPESAETHHWLSDRAAQLESLLSETMAEFLHKEDLLDDHAQLSLPKLSDRVQAAALAHE